MACSNLSLQSEQSQSEAQRLVWLLHCYTYMKAVVETLEANKVKLSVEVDEAEFEKDIDAAFRKIAREVRIPGFRPGKAPRRILEARLGKDAGRSEAIRDSLPDYYARAVFENEIDVIAAPELEVKSGEGDGPVSFEAVVEVRPRITIAGYESLKVEIPSPAVSDADVDAQLDRMRARFGELVPAGRAAKEGDFVNLDVSAFRDGTPVASLSADDFLYEVGSASVLAEFDEHLDGAGEGDVLEFEADLPGEGAASVKLVVKEVKTRELPPLTDEWAAEASEFDTLEELKADLAQRMGLVKRAQASVAMRNGALEALTELVDDDLPQAMIDSEVQRQVHDLGHRLEAQRATVEDYLAATGQSVEEFMATLSRQAVPSVKADLALRAVADGQSIDPTDDDMEAEFARLAQAYGMDPGRVRHDLEAGGQIAAVRADWKKTRALEWLLEHVEVVDTEGKLVDRALLEGGPGTLATEGAQTEAAQTEAGQSEAGQDDQASDDEEMLDESLTGGAEDEEAAQ